MNRPARKARAAKHQSRKSKTVREELLTSDHSEAQDLYRLALQVKTLEPWKWMEEKNLFGVQDPLTKEIGFLSVMGSAGAHYAISVYPGEAALCALLDFASGLANDSNDTEAQLKFLAIPQLQVSFSDPDSLEKRDRDLLKGTGLKFKGLRPCFRSSRPGYLPWFITREEARVLIHALSQTIIVAERLFENPDLLAFDEEKECLVRVSHEENSQLVWEDRLYQTSTPPDRVLTGPVDPTVLARLTQTAQEQIVMEVDLLIVPSSIGGPGTRPVAVFGLMLVDQDSGLIRGMEMLTATGEEKETSTASRRKEPPTPVVRDAISRTHGPQAIFEFGDPDPASRTGAEATSPTSGETKAPTVVHNVTPASEGFDRMYAELPDKLARMLLATEVRPTRLKLRSKTLHELFSPLARELQIVLERSRNLPTINSASKAMFDMMLDDG